MKKTSIALEDWVETFKIRKSADIPGFRYYPHAIEILALRKLGVKHRIIADFLNDKIKGDRPITNNYLSTIISRWKSSGLLQGRELEIETTAQAIKKQAEADSLHMEAETKIAHVVEENHAYDPFREVDSVERHNIVEFLKRLEKKSESILSENEKTVAKDYFKTVDKQSDFESAVDKCLSIIKGTMA